VRITPESSARVYTGARTLPPGLCALMADKGTDEDRLFVRDGWRHYRRTYSLREVRWGLAVAAVLAAVAGWIWWKGRHPDPALFSDGTALLKAASPAAAPAASRGPLPPGLAGPGWREERISEFDPENLYVKIDGRADWFKSFGFRKLHGVLLVSEKDPATTIDVEMYDLARAANALGAYGGERAPDVKPQLTDKGLFHIARNALYMARGPYYLRVIGSDESPAVTEKLHALADTLGKQIAGEPLPWAYGLFVGGMGLDPGKVSYFVENAFSFSFARDVWAVRPKGKDDDLELFVVARADAAGAKALAEKLRQGFLGFGAPAGKQDGVPLIKDQFLNALTAVTTQERWVLGVRGAATKELLAGELRKLQDALAQAPKSLKDRAQPAVEKGGGGDDR
jgi:hypothetical protein